MIPDHASLTPAQRARLADLPIFPLPQVVLFPGMRLPLHVFEPRYRALVRDVLAGERMLVMGHLTGDGGRPSVDPSAPPAFATVAGVGVIVEHNALDDGRFNILVEGVARARIAELPFIGPYRRVAAALLEDDGDTASAIDASALLSAASSFAAAVRRREPTFSFELPAGRSIGALADLCAGRLLIDPDERQALLETLEVARRVRETATGIAGQMTLFRQAGAGDAN